MTRQVTGPPDPRATTLETLHAAQRDRFRALDPQLGDPLPPATGLPSLWCARELWTLYPVLGANTGGLDALLTGWRTALLAEPVARQRDSACVLTWPSRDAEAAATLLAHGFVPLSVLAVRPELAPAEPARRPQGASPISVRDAGPEDLPIALELSMAELEYSALVGAAIARQDARGLKRAALGYRLRSGSGDVLLAERDGVVVGLAEVLRPGESGGQDALLSTRNWGYLNCVSVWPAARGAGVGDALVAAAHERLRRAGMDASYLYYNPPNPLSSVFWPRHGYRPVWTIWEIRPAGALR